MHERVARRFHSTIVTNQGLWIKAGQALGLQAALLPKPYRTAFSDIFDDAPTVPYAEIENVIRQDMKGKTPEEIFTTFEHRAVNSASIAQVHRATVQRAEIGSDGKPTGKTWMEDVAVKVSETSVRVPGGVELISSVRYVDPETRHSETSRVGFVVLPFFEWSGREIVRYAE